MSAELNIQSTQYKPQTIKTAAKADETKYLVRRDIDQGTLSVIRKRTAVGHHYEASEPTVANDDNGSNPGLTGRAGNF